MREMHRIIINLMACLALGFGALASPVALAAEPAAKAPAKPVSAPTAKTAPRTAAGTGQVFDARDPASLIALLGTLGAKAEITTSADDAVFLKVLTPNYGFNVQYAGCNASKRACKAIAFSAPSDRRGPTLQQVNRFNQTAIACRAYQDQAGALHAVYDALIFSADSRDEMTSHLGAWQGCLAAFGEFMDDPAGYLATAP